MKRREFLLQLPLAVAAAGSGCARASRPTGPSAVRFGVIADLHQDVIHDAEARVTAFVDAMIAARVDFILQLGDFCCPTEPNRSFLAAWNRFPGPRHHVLGNHDMDGGFSRDATVAYYGMPARHYAFDHGPLRCLVLDGNDPGGQAPGYRRFIGPDQLAWLQAELSSGEAPLLLFVHQALDHPQGIENQQEVRRMIADARRPEGAPRVLAVWSGHHHQDWVNTLAGTHYLQVNSASYQWVGEAFAHDSYPPDLVRHRPYLRMTCPYRDPLWAVVTVDLRAGALTLEGRRSDWVGPGPQGLGVPSSVLPPETAVPEIRSRQLRVEARRAVRS